jgi:hypothetical protein
MADESGKRITVYLTDVQKERLNVIKDKRQTDNITRTMAWLVDDEWRRVENHNTKEDLLHTILTEQMQIQRKQDMTLLLVWRLLASEKVEVSAEDVRKLRELLAEIQL